MARLALYDATEFPMRHAIAEIEEQFSERVDYKGKSLIKFGRNTDLAQNTVETIWPTGGNETYLTDNLITHVSSSDAGDTQDVVIEGHTIDGNGDFTFVVQTVTLDGQNAVALGTPLARATRGYVDDSTDLAGTAYIHQSDTLTAGVPDTTSKIHLQIEAGENQSFKCATTISKDDYWVLTTAFAAVQKKANANIDLYLQVRLKGKVFRSILPLQAASDGSNAVLKIEPAIIIPPNTDVRVVGESDTTGSAVTAWIGGYLCN